MFKVKKGDMVSTTVITLVILVTTVVILLFVWASINSGQVINDAVCQESIVLRSTFNFGDVEPGREEIPLKCRTKKFCLTSTGGDCENVFSGTKKNPVEKVDISASNAKNDVIDGIVDAMYNCNFLLGEGKLNFLPSSTFDNEKYCLVCSRIFAEDEVKTLIDEEIQYKDLYARMQEREDRDGNSYLGYLYPGWNNWQDVVPIFSSLKEGIDYESDSYQNSSEIEKEMAQRLEEMTIEDWKMHFPLEADVGNQDRGYAVVSVVWKESSVPPLWQGIIFSLGGVSGQFMLWNHIDDITFTGPKKSAMVASNLKFKLPDGSDKSEVGLSGIMYSYDFANEDYYYMPPVIIPFEDDAINALQCDNFEFAP